MSNPFHLALPAGDIDSTLKFYTEILGCKTGNKEEGKWVDVDFWGNEFFAAAVRVAPAKQPVRVAPLGRPGVSGNLRPVPPRGGAEPGSVTAAGFGCVSGPKR